MDYYKHKDTKERRFSLDTKTTSDLKVATKPCGKEIFVTLVKAALAALCIFSCQKEHSLFVSLCFNIKKLSDSVTLCLTSHTFRSKQQLPAAQHLVLVHPISLIAHMHPLRPLLVLLPDKLVKVSLVHNKVHNLQQM